MIIHLITLYSEISARFNKADNTKPQIINPFSFPLFEKKKSAIEFFDKTYVCILRILVVLKYERRSLSIYMSAIDNYV